MGERKGTNHYYPPDYDPRKGGLNKFLGTHALRERARKIHLGILIIRFEMPYNIWCEGCNNHIGMGVRYNAEKKKIGMYYTTPVYQFRMKCHLCDNHFEIKTDPGNMDYVIVSGARRQENRWDPTQNEQVVPEDKDTQKRLFDDAMFKLEHGNKDESTAKRVAPALGRLVNRNEYTWKDDFAANQALRSQFRAKKKELLHQEEKDSRLLRKSSLNISLVPEHEDDIRLASLLSLAPSRTMMENQDRARGNIMNRPVLPNSAGRTMSFLGLRASKQLENSHKSSLNVRTAVRKNSQPCHKTLESAKCISDSSINSVLPRAKDVLSSLAPVFDVARTSNKVLDVACDSFPQNVEGKPKEQEYEPEVKKFCISNASDDVSLETEICVKTDSEACKKSGSALPDMKESAGSSCTPSLVSGEYESSESDDSQSHS